MFKASLLWLIQQAVEGLLTAKFDTLRNELRAEMDLRFDQTEPRFDQIESRASQFETRMDGFERRLAEAAEDVKSHGIQLARLEQRIIDFKESLDVERRPARLEPRAGLDKR